jgi:hypothetical protein
VRHRHIRQAAGALRRGRQIEQLLGRDRLDDVRWAVRWLTISPSSSGYRVLRHEVEDVGAEWGTADVSEFPPLDEEEHVGEGVELGSCSEPEAAMDLARAHAATDEKWVNAGVIGDEYLDSTRLRNRRYRTGRPSDNPEDRRVDL